MLSTYLAHNFFCYVSGHEKRYSRAADGLRHSMWVEFFLSTAGSFNIYGSFFPRICACSFPSYSPSLWILSDLFDLIFEFLTALGNREGSVAGFLTDLWIFLLGLVAVTFLCADEILVLFFVVLLILFCEIFVPFSVRLAFLLTMTP